MGLVFYEKRRASFSLLVGADKERLIVARGGVGVIEVVYDCLSGGEDFGTFERAGFDRDFAMAAASVKGELDFVCVVIPVERVFHLVAVVEVASVGFNWREWEVEMMLGERIFDESLFCAQFKIVVHNLPRTC